MIFKIKKLLTKNVLLSFKLINGLNRSNKIYNGFREIYTNTSTSGVLRYLTNIDNTEFITIIID